MSLKKFEIQEMIAKGGMAEVYKAKTVGFQGFEKEVCVKKILPHLTEDDSFVKMFIDEAKLAATLNYANIVQVHDLCVSAGGEYFIVMEYIHGKDLSDVIRAAQLAAKEVPPEIAVYVTREVCKGLYYAHSKADAEGAKLNIIHRDISPHNVLTSFMGEVKITDFGIAKASSIMNKTAVGILKGKYGYMSPEQARGQPLDHRSDIFNTGIVLYELLVGERCFAGSSDFSTLNLMRNAEVTPPTKIVTSVPKEIEDIVLKTLSKDPNDRFQDALDLERALAQWAKKANASATATDLADFMRELFSNTSTRAPDSSTGVLSLASVVGPAPQSKDEPAKHATKAPPSKAASQVSADPGRAALERAKKRAKSKAQDAPKEAVPEPKVETPKPKKTPTKAEPASSESAKPVSKPAKPISKPAAKKVEPPAAKEEAPKPEAPAKEAAAPKPAAAKLPAKIKKDAPPAKPVKRKGKQTVTDKKPVGRRDLRPGLTQLHRIERRSGRVSVVKAGVFVAVMVGFGAAIGAYRGNQMSRQTTFREIEVANRAEDVADKNNVFILIDSDPPGATVKFDSIELEERTPVAIERARDTEAHQVQLTRDGYKSATRSLKYTSDRMTYFTEVLEGDPARLEVTTQPSGLPVKMDGTSLGETPLAQEIPHGKHKLEIGGGDRATIVEHIDVKVGERIRLSKDVPEQGALAALRLQTSVRAQVFLNDNPTPQWTNEAPLKLLPNVAHELILKFGKNGNQRKKIAVRLSRGERRHMYVELEDAS